MPVLIAGSRKCLCKAIIFDKDGTLLDSSAAISALGRERFHAIQEVAGAEAACRWQKWVGFDAESGRVDPNGPLSLASKRDEGAIAAAAIYQGGIPWIQAFLLSNRAYALADSRLRSPYGFQVLPGIPDVLRRLRDAGFLLAVATTDQQARTRETLNDLGIGIWLDAILAADDVTNGKPAPDMVLETCKRLGIEPAEATVVGDTEADMRMGRAAGAALCVGVKTGLNRGSGLDGLADVILDSVAQLSTA
jgi:phosphoglycolate phosphatase